MPIPDVVKNLFNTTITYAQAKYKKVYIFFHGKPQNNLYSSHSVNFLYCPFSSVSSSIRFPIETLFK